MTLPPVKSIAQVKNITAELKVNPHALDFYSLTIDEVMT